MGRKKTKEYYIGYQEALDDMDMLLENGGWEVIDIRLKIINLKLRAYIKHNRKE